MVLSNQLFAKNNGEDDIIVLRKIMCLLLAMLVLFSLSDVLAIAYADNSSDAAASNMFIGTINGENVVAYLDYTYATYFFDGMGYDMDASFVSFDDAGLPQYKIGIRIDSKTKPGFYNVNTKVIDYVSAYLDYDEDKLSFHDYYRIVEGATDWAVNFDVIDFESGIVKGSVSAILLPSMYNRTPYPTQSSVSITGTFEFQLKTIHPMMAEYREVNEDYAAAFEVSYSQTVGSPTFSFSSSSDSNDSNKNAGKKTSERVCSFCRGTKKCHVCYGFGYTVTGNSHNRSGQGGVGTHQCTICGGSGRCTHCY